LKDLTKPKTLSEISSNVSSCTKCGLAESRINTVPGEGNPLARLVLIGEAPGRKEDELGRPFVGSAGKILDQVLSTVELSRDVVYILNILKCRPPRNRRPKKSEIKLCEEFLELQLSILKPLIIASMGNSALQYLFKKYMIGKAVIGDVHGSILNIETSWGPVKLVPLYHPAAAIYNRELLDVLKEDMKVATELLISCE
jgi:DNA polymerase